MKTFKDCFSDGSRAGKRRRENRGIDRKKRETRGEREKEKREGDGATEHTTKWTHGQSATGGCKSSSTTEATDYSLEPRHSHTQSLQYPV